MDKEKFIAQMGAHPPVSVGLAAYLRYVMLEEHYRSKDRIYPVQSELNTLSLLFKGSARLYLEQHETKEEITMMFYLEEGFLVTEREMEICGNSKLAIEFLEDSTLYLIPDKHIGNLYKLFPEFHLIHANLNRMMKTKMFSHQLKQSQLDAEGRYEQFLKNYPKIALVCEQKKIASFLGIDPKTLSRIRGKFLK